MSNSSWTNFLTPLLPADWALPPQLPFCFRDINGELTWQLVKSKTHGDTRCDHFATASGLRLQCTIQRLMQNQTAVVKLKLTNTAKTTTAPLLRIEPLRLTVSTDAEPVYGRTTGGGVNEKVYPPHAFRHDTLHLQTNGFLWTENGFDGRSSNRDLPFLTLTAGTGGLTFTLEWTGLWWGSIIGPSRMRELTASIHIPIQNLVLAPGETLTLPAAHYVFSHADGLAGTVNAFRRYLNRCVLPRIILPPVSYNHWFGTGPDISENLLAVRVPVAAKLGAEYFIVDAGWYPGCPSGNFDAGVGNLTHVDRDKFPRGLAPLATRVRKAKMKFGLWFEIERAHRTSRWVKEHPEWFWDTGENFLHLNLTRPDAQDAAVALMVNAVRELDLAWIKLDYNCGPLAFWKMADPTGKIQFAYCDGLYRVLDETLRQCPDLVMECCASGGRRIDLGILRRAHTAWVSDECHNAENTRFMQTGANALLPGQIANSGIPFGRDEGSTTFTDYEALSRMLGSFQIAGDITLLTPERRQRLRELVNLFKCFRHLLSQDFYPLLPQPKSDQDWEAVQFATRNGSENLVLVFSGTKPSEQHQPVLHLCNLSANRLYQIEPLHQPTSPVKRTGSDLMKNGLIESLSSLEWAGWLIQLAKRH